MNLSDLKFFVILAILGVVLYAVIFPWNWSRYPWVRRNPPKGPGYIIVPKDYPGARPLEEVRDRVPPPGVDR